MRAEGSLRLIGAQPQRNHSKLRRSSNPWRTWLTCEETFEHTATPHGYIFEVSAGALCDPIPLRGMSATARSRRPRPRDIGVGWNLLQF